MKGGYTHYQLLTLSAMLCLLFLLVWDIASLLLVARSSVRQHVTSTNYLNDFVPDKAHKNTVIPGSSALTCIC
jgi:hypothetical protein